MFTASSFYHDRSTIELTTPYDPEFVDTLKDQVPFSHRRWNPESKTWFVTAPYDTVAIRILEFYFPGAEVGSRPGATVRTSGCACDADHRALFVCQNAPEPVIKAAYRALAKLAHPDAGGDAERMRAINTAYERLTSGGAA